MKIKFQLPDFSQFPSTEFNASLSQSSEIFRSVGMGKEAGQEYEAIRQRLILFAVHQETEFRVDKPADVYRIFSVLIQESVPDDVLGILLQEDGFYRLLQSIIPNIDESNWELVCKKVLTLYYSRYYDLNKLPIEARKMFDNLIQELMRKYDGKNRMVLQAVPRVKPILQGAKYILESYPRGTELRVIYNDLFLLSHFEIWEELQIAYFIERAKSWHPNQYDESVQSILKEILIHKDKILIHKDKSIGGPRSLLEEVACIMLSKCHDIGRISPEWLEWLREHVGDPRLSRYEEAWLRIGCSLYRWVRGLLSQQDVEEFLTIMTDGKNDEIYQYRQQFWMQYVNRVQFSKVMLGQDAKAKVEKTQPELFKRIDKDPEIYSSLDENERSCIYIDFGDFCVIEGTHSAKVRFYKESPIDLTGRSYQYQDFYTTTKASNTLIHEVSHHGSDRYHWQNLIRNYLSNKFRLHVLLDKIFLPDLHIGARERIKQDLYSKGQSID